MATSLKDFHHQLRHHDWYYDMSDDINVWRRGEAARAAIMTVTKESPLHRQLYEDFFAHYFTGPDWAGVNFRKERPPLPEEPS